MEKNKMGNDLLDFGMVFNLPLRAIKNTEMAKSYYYDKDFLKMPLEMAIELWGDLGRVYQDDKYIVCEVQR